ncbi:MAG: pyridoxamine 5'-phosphate oxidase [Pseudomonadota bacterium]
MTHQIVSDFLPDTLPANPFALVADWLAAARDGAHQPNPTAMTLASVAADGRPTARIVLCKGLHVEAGAIDFYTNYRSRKAATIAAHADVAVVFHWDHYARQVRIEGRASPLGDDDNDAYFATRPRLSQMGAWASDQSEPIASRDALLQQFETRNAAFDEEAPVPRPPHWGGYRIHARACELWVEGAGRVHDRARFERSLDGTDTDAWSGQRLQP